MEKISIKKEFYFEKYEFLKFYVCFSEFYLIFKLIFTNFFIFKIAKNLVSYLQALTWRAGPGAADVACGTASGCDAAMRPRGRARVAHAGRGWR